MSVPLCIRVLIIPLLPFYIFLIPMHSHFCPPSLLLPLFSYSCSHVFSLNSASPIIFFHTSMHFHSATMHSLPPINFSYFHAFSLCILLPPCIQTSAPFTVLSHFHLPFYLASPSICLAHPQITHRIRSHFTRTPLLPFSVTQFMTVPGNQSDYPESLYWKNLRDYSQFDQIT